jgi:hypothetical protein
VATGNADKYAKIGGGNTDTLTRQAIGNDNPAGAGPFPPGAGGGGAIEPEPTLLVEPVIDGGTPAPPP